MVMRKLVKIAVNATPPLIRSDNSITEDNSNAVFDYAYPILIAELYPSTASRTQRIANINTLANRIHDHSNGLL